jgi:hypothetical protein
MDRKRKLDLFEAANAPSGLLAAQTATDGGINPYTGRPYTKRYYDILSTRQSERWD